MVNVMKPSPRVGQVNAAILKNGGGGRTWFPGKTRDADLPDFARLPAAPDPLGNQHEE